MSTNAIIGLIIGGIVVLGGGYFIFGSGSNEAMKNDSAMATTSSDAMMNGDKTKASDGAMMEAGASVDAMTQ